MSGPRLVIVGAGGFARETVEIARRVQPNTALAYVDDRPSDDAVRLMSEQGVLYLGAAHSWEAGADDLCVVAIGDPETRATLAAALAHRGTQFTTLVHPDSTLAASAVLSPGVIVAPGARVSANVVLGRHVQVDQNATIGHDTTVGDHARLNPLSCVSGDVTLGDLTYVGAAAVILQGLYVGERALIGAGAVVTRDVAAHATVKGIPAR